MKRIVTIVISSIGNRVNNIRINNVKSSLSTMLIHQKPCKDFNYSIPWIDKCISLDDSGLSKSRNFGLKHTDTKYAYIMDDDVEFDSKKILDLVDWMEVNHIDVATCRFKFDDGSYPKRYKKNAFKHNLFTSTGISSIELCINVQSINVAGIRFDERFGLGTPLPSGEEYIFIADCIRSDLNVWYYPITVGIHQKVTSGMDFYSTPNKVLAKREMLKRVFGHLAYLVIFLFWAKKIPKIIRSGYFLSFTKTLFLGGKL